MFPLFFNLTPISRRLVIERLIAKDLHARWHIHCNIFGGMNLRDLLIIYLACGAPFGVYYYLQNRHQTETKILFLKVVFRFVFWIPFAVQMVARKSLFTNLYNNGFDKHPNLDAKKESVLEEIKKYFESLFLENDFSFSIYEFREIFERYVGLSLENETSEISPAEQEIFRISNHSNKKVAEICLNRRNRIRLSFHQKLARRDFLEIVGKIVENAAEPEKILIKTLALADTVKDEETRRLVENFAEESLQTTDQTNVRNWEKELWRPDKHKPFTDSQISTNLQVMTAATTKLSRKD
jgi:hypothetical protein